MKAWDEAALKTSLSFDDFDEYTIASTPGDAADISMHRGARRIVNLGAIAHNYRLLLRMTNKAIIAVVKARAYGGGLVPVASRLLPEGCCAFAVASLGAAVALRRALEQQSKSVIKRETILVLGFVPPVALRLARDCSISVTITDPDIWPLYRKAIDEMEDDIEEPLSFHLKLDTGMNRIGVPVTSTEFERALLLARQVRDCSRAYLQGVFTHFPLADDVRTAGSYPERFTLGQIKTVRAVVRAMAREDLTPPMIHLANSPALEQYPESHDEDWITHVRVGSLLHGISISNQDRVRRATRWEATLTRVEQMPYSMGVGYGHTYRAWRGQHVGTLSVGYADGYLPGQTGQTNWIRLAGIALPVIGRVAMDMCMVDLEPYVKRRGRAPEPGSIVELLSDDQPGDLLSMESVGQRWGVSWPVVLCGIRTRNTLVYEESDNFDLPAA